MTVVSYATYGPNSEAAMLGLEAPQPRQPPLAGQPKTEEPASGKELKDQTQKVNLQANLQILLQLSHLDSRTESPLAGLWAKTPRIPRMRMTSWSQQLFLGLKLSMRLFRSHLKSSALCCPNALARRRLMLKTKAQS